MIQTIMIPKEDFTKEQAHEWIVKNNHKDNSFNETDTHYNFKQNPIKSARGRYFTVKLPNNILLLNFKSK